MQWSIKNQSLPQTIAEFMEIIWENREISDRDQFLAPKHPTEFSLSDVGIDAEQVEKACQRLLQARESQELVVVFGDYDADGVCSTTLLWQALHQAGLNVLPFIPHREKHGYGMSERSLTALLEQCQPSLVITVDNGIVALEAVKTLKAKGIDVIITDHHQPEKDATTGQPILPAADAIVHSTQLCGTTVAWFLAQDIKKNLGGSPKRNLTYSDPLDVCAIATIADQMPLLGINRSFAVHGLAQLRRSERVGLVELCLLVDVDQKSITTSSVHFGLAPRINAMGRMGHSMDAVRLLCTNSQEKAHELAQVLSDTNVKRQSVTTEMMEHALDNEEKWADKKIIIVASPEYHEGVIGLIAGKLCEKFYKPAIAIALGDPLAKASARSVAGVNVTELIRQVRDELLEVGGHPMAAGFGFESKNVASIQSRLEKLAEEQISNDLLEPKLNIEVQVPLPLATEELYQALESLQPFGQANPEPIISLPNVIILEVMQIGNRQQHLKLTVTSKEGSQLHHTPITCVGWGMGEAWTDLKPQQVIDIAGILEMNHWKNRHTLQLRLKDINVS